MMEIRVFLVALALVLLCASPASGTLSSTSIVISDTMVDSSGQRGVAIDIQVVTTGTTEATPQVCSASAITISPATNWNSPVLQSPTCAGSSCTQVIHLTTTSTPCPFSGTFIVSYNLCGDGLPSGPAASSQLILHQRSVCSSTLYSFSANISSYGAFGDAGFSQTKTQYYINDMVFFPFHVIYNDLTIASLTFNTITVDSDTSSPVVLYSASSNTGAGNVVNLKTSALSGQLSTGTATMWFGLEINRQDGSPFATTPSSVTSYTFSVVFDITYKNAKRSLAHEQGQLHSKATIMVNSREAVPLIAQNLKAIPPQQMLTGAGHALKGGVLGVFCFVLGVSFLIAF